MTICKEEVYALMLIGQRSFFVQPLTNGQHVMFQPKNEKWWSIRNNSSFVSVNPENPAGEKDRYRDGFSSFVRRLDVGDWLIDLPTSLPIML